MDETERRRAIQEVYNRENGITPQTIVKPIEATLITASEADYFKVPTEVDEIEDYSPANIEATITRLEVEMRAAAKRFEFEKAAELRDRIKVLRERELRLCDRITGTGLQDFQDLHVNPVNPVNPCKSYANQSRIRMKSSRFCRTRVLSAMDTLSESCCRRVSKKFPKSSLLRIEIECR